MKVFSFERGSVFFEVIMASALLLIAVMAFVPLFVMANSNSKNDFQKSVAQGVAEKQMDAIRSLAYDNIGRVGGNPGGTVAATSTVTSNNITFTVKSNVRWVDDPADGVSPADQDPTDYKQITVDVSWAGASGARTLSRVSNVSRQSEQQINTNGNVRAIVRDTDNNLVPDAVVLLTAPPSLSQTQYTDVNGEAFFANLTPSVTAGDYTLSVSIGGYVVRPDQVVQTTTVIAGDTRVLEFIIDQPGQITVTLQDASGTIIPKQCKLTLSNPYAGQTEYPFFNNGPFNIINLFPANWGIVPYVPSYDYLGPPITAVVTSGSSQDIVITMTPHPSGNLHLVLRDANTSVLIGGNVVLTDLNTSDTMNLTVGAGGVLDTSIAVSNWQVAVTKTGYDPQTVTTSIVTGNNPLTVNLVPHVNPGAIRVRAEKTNHNARSSVKIAVSTTNNSNTIFVQGTTDNNGYITFSGLAPGTYYTWRDKTGWYDPRVVIVTAGIQSEVVYSW